MTSIIDSFGRGDREVEEPHARAEQRALGDAATDVQGSFTPYAPFVAGSVPSVGGAQGNEGQLATHVIGDILDGKSIDVSAYAQEAGAIAGGAVGSAVPGIGTILGAIIGGAIGKILGGAFGGGGDDCDPDCYANKVTAQIAPQICMIRETGQMDPVCSAAVHQASLDQTWNSFLFQPVTGTIEDEKVFQPERFAAFNALLAKYKITLVETYAPADPPGGGGGLSPDGYLAANDKLYKARIGAAAAARRLADDIDWSQRIIVAANHAASAYGPDCPSCDSACLDLVKATAIDYATAAHPYGQGSEQATEGFAHESMVKKMAAIIQSSKASHTCPTLGEKSDPTVQYKAKCLTWHGMTWDDQKHACTCPPPNVLNVNPKNGDTSCDPVGQKPSWQQDALAGDVGDQEEPKGHGLLFKGTAALLAAGAVYSGVQFARGKPNQIATQGKKLYGKAKARVQKMRR